MLLEPSEIHAVSTIVSNPNFNPPTSAVWALAALLNGSTPQAHYVGAQYEQAADLVRWTLLAVSDGRLIIITAAGDPGRSIIDPRNADDQLEAVTLSLEYIEWLAISDVADRADKYTSEANLAIQWQLKLRTGQTITFPTDNDLSSQAKQREAADQLVRTLLVHMTTQKS